MKVLDLIAEQTGFPVSTVDSILNSLTTCTEKLLREGETIELPFGKIAPRDLKERKGRNPATGEALTLSPKRKASLKVAKKFEERIQPTSMPESPLPPPPPPPPAKTWQIHLDGETISVAEPELKGKLKADTPVWIGDRWTQAQMIPELVSYF
ncbi:MAG TPA: HU family DNA-binding protein [Oscillatoriales cyanobacterium M59_W2019_021]|nr:MAG: HU family DNA-binding protein [Cyanobacteria bacterium J055]HIK29893.1 HU family DNA-binding protein [Oscillatoriales cyanobacterium M4454_W2019_049]HIK49409.1 HU family DNA-binding protein [Oscillatoriales cyanobacterium M59_W2019_021]